MTDTEIQREIERAQRNASQLRALVAEHERTTASSPMRRPAPSGAITPHALRA
jgi:hypothetical protein